MGSLVVQVGLDVHPVMQDADNLNTPWRLPIEDQMSSHVIFPVAGANTSGDRQ